MNYRPTAAWFLAAACMAASAIAHASAGPLPEHEWTPTARTWAARVCFAEASWRYDDCSALLYVVTRRWEQAGGAWLDMLKRYAAVGNPSTERQHRIALYPWGDVPGWPRAHNRRWAELRAYVVAWGAGKVPDPCPTAVHWGSPTDRAPTGTVLARCSVVTANVFYARAE